MSYPSIFFRDQVKRVDPSKADSPSALQGGLGTWSGGMVRLMRLARF